MADLKISALSALAGADLVAADVVAVVDDSASETKKLTVSDLIANGVTLISDATIPSAKILFSAGSVATAGIADGAVTTAKIANSAVTAAKLADNSSVTLVSGLPGSGDFVGQVALDTADNSKIYVWSGSAWTSVKAAGSINVVNGSTSGLVNITATTSGDTVTISTTLDDTSAARQFLAGPTGSGGTVGYRAIIGTDLPTASSSAKGGVIVNGNGLAMSGDTLTVDNSVTAETTENHLVKYDANGLVTSGRVIASGDVPVATSSATGAVLPGTGLSVTGSGVLNHSNSLTAATGLKISFDAQGHITGSTALVATDIPNLDAAKITTGSLASARIADDAITADKLADRSTATIAEVTPEGGAYIGQTHLNSITGDYFLWDGNVWQPIGISVGEIVLAGTYNATTNLVATVTTEGTAVGYTVGSALPAASSSNKGHYVIVSTAGTGTSPAPTVALAPPDFLLSTGTLYTEIDVSQTVTAQQASNIQFTPTGSIASNNVQTALAEVDTEKAPKASPTFSGTVSLDTAATIQFEGSSANDFETTLTVTDPTADRSLALPNVSGTLVSTGDTGSVTSTMITDGTIVNADINASAEIAVSKLANGTARQLLQTDSGGAGVEFTSNVDVPGTLDVTSAATFDSTVAVAGVLSANGKLAYPAGTAAAVSLYSGTDTDTGIYSPGANEFGIATAGTSRIVVDANGKLGIGESTNLDALLVIKGNSDGAATPSIRLKDGSDTREAWITNQSGDLSLNVRGDDNVAHGTLKLFESGVLDYSQATGSKLRIDSSGNLGVGETSPSANLIVKQSGSTFTAQSQTVGLFQRSESSAHGAKIAIVAGNNANSDINFGDTDDEDVGIIQYFHSDNSFRFRTNASASPAIFINSSGNVGINSTNPLAEFQVKATTDVNLGIANSGTRASISAYNDAGSANIPLQIVSSETKFVIGNSDAAIIDSSGNVGINQDSPDTRLDVDGAFFLRPTTQTFPDENGAGLRLRSDTNRLQLRGLQWTPSVVYYDIDYLGLEHEWSVNGSPKMKLDSSGRLLMGSSSTSNSGLLCVKGNASSSTGAGELTLQKGSGVTGADQELGAYNLGEGSASTAKIRAFTGANWTGSSRPTYLTFETTASGSSGPTERLKIDSNGRVRLNSGGLSLPTEGEYTTPLYVSLEGMTDPTANPGASLNSVIRTMDRGSNSNAYTGIELRNRMSGDLRILNQDSNISNRATLNILQDTDLGGGGLENVLTISYLNAFLASGVYDHTTSGSANVNVVSGGQLRRSTSSIKYKTQVETLEDSYADALLNCRPVWYRSTCAGDNANHSHWGLIAEEVAEIDPRLVHWSTTNINYVDEVDENGDTVYEEDGKTPRKVRAKTEEKEAHPEGVAYERFVPHLLNLIKRQQTAIKTLETKVAALEAG